MMFEVMKGELLSSGSSFAEFCETAPLFWFDSGGGGGGGIEWFSAHEMVDPRLGSLARTFFPNRLPPRDLLSLDSRSMLPFLESMGMQTFISPPAIQLLHTASCRRASACAASPRLSCGRAAAVLVTRLVILFAEEMSQSYYASLLVCFWTMAHLFVQGRAGAFS